VLDLIATGTFSAGDSVLFSPFLGQFFHDDPYMLMADYRWYVDAQETVSRAFKDRNLWARMSILNVARSGKFSSDRAVRQYCDDIWHVGPIPAGPQTGPGSTQDRH